MKLPPAGNTHGAAGAFGGVLNQYLGAVRARLLEEAARLDLLHEAALAYAPADAPVDGTAE
ncbi:MAG: hypothetical protein ACYC0B_06260, partial [Gemmatimonadaceae bacterium]